MSGAEGAVKLSIAMLDSLFDFADTGRLAADVDCVSGMIANTLTDNDGGGTITAGDEVQMDFANCNLEVLGLPISGRVVLGISSLTINLDLSVSGQVTIRFPQPLEFREINGVRRSVSGALTVSFTASADIEDMVIETLPVGGFELRLAAGSATNVERYTDFRITRSIDTGDAYVIDFDSSIDSDLNGGNYRCSTPASLEAALGSFPIAGLVECSGGSNTMLRLELATIDSLETLVDPIGGGTLVDAFLPPGSSGTWNDYIEGDLIATKISRPEVDRREITPTVASTSFDIAINDAVYSSVTGILYVSNDGGVIEFDPDNLRTGRSVQLAGRPGPVAISDDGTALWVGLQDRSEIVQIDTGTMSAAAVLPLGASLATSGERIALDIEVAPGTTESVVVTMLNLSEVVAYRDGAALNNIILGNGLIEEIEFLDSTSIVGVGNDANLVELDANGLTLKKSLRNVGRSGLTLGNQNAFVSTGHVFNVNDEQVVGRIRFRGFGSDRDGQYIDRSAGIAYFYNRIRSVLDFYDESRLVPLGSYRMLWNGSLLRILETADSRLMFVFTTGVRLVDKSLLLPTLLGDPCRTEDLSGQFELDFLIQTSCRFNDAIYDRARDLIYATMPSFNGPHGNSVALIDPRTGTLQSTIFVGSEPTSLAMSASGDILYVALSEATSVATVNLQTQALSSLIRTRPNPPVGEPSFPVKVAASPSVETQLLVAHERTVDIYSDGIPSLSGPFGAWDVEALFYRSDGQTAWGVKSGSDFWEWAIDPGGLRQLREVWDVLAPSSLKLKDDMFYDAFGSIIDPVTLSAVATCPLPTVGVVEPDRNGSYVYYWLPGIESKLVACDLTDFSLGQELVVPDFRGTFGDVDALVWAGPDRLVLVGLDRMMFLNPQELH